jgi:putative ubiquitin-RnfH superfamily antitoxin RatB of RatAB toxin-antitoxin module
MADTIAIEVAFAGPSGQQVRQLHVPRGTTVMGAIDLSGIPDEFPDVTIDPTQLGIFSRRVEAMRTVEEGDRVEIYRPLILDPMEARRRRARRDA